jgi:hypothetical protein
MSEAAGNEDPTRNRRGFGIRIRVQRPYIPGCELGSTFTASVDKDILCAA